MAKKIGIRNLILSVFFIGVYALYQVIGYYYDRNLNSEPLRSNPFRKVTNVVGAKDDVERLSLMVVRHISECNSFPKSFMDFVERHGPMTPEIDQIRKENGKCSIFTHNDYLKYLARKNFKEDDYYYGLAEDPWGRPFQIRYDLERAKLQVRSRGRILLWDGDDIVGETFFNGNSYKAQVEYCKSVPKDDMSCIFNRGWH